MTDTAAQRGILFTKKQKLKSHFSLMGVSETRFYYPLSECAPALC